MQPLSQLETTLLPKSTAMQRLAKHLVVLQWHGDDKAPRGLSIEQRIVACDVRLARYGTHARCIQRPPVKAISAAVTPNPPSEQS